MFSCFYVCLHCCIYIFVAFTLNISRVCRISQALRHSFFSRHKPGSGGGGGSSGGGGGGGGGGAGGSGSATSNGGGRQLTRTRARIMRTSNSVVRGGITPSNTSRTSSSVIMGSGSISNASSRPMVPAPVYVPEELVSQAQVVLQGKSRNLIVRELQVRFGNSESLFISDLCLFVKNFRQFF